MAALIVSKRGLLNLEDAAALVTDSEWCCFALRVMWYPSVKLVSRWLNAGTTRERV